MISHAPDSAMPPEHLPHTPGLVALSILSIVLAFGCGNDGGTGTAGTHGAGATGGAGPEPEDPVFVAAHQIFSTDQPFTIVTASPSLEAVADATVVASGIEFPGRATVFGSTTVGAAFVVDSEGPTITRLDLQEDGTLAPGARVSFANLGVTGFFGLSSISFRIVSPTRAYYFDNPTAQVIVFDPTEMTVTTTIDISDAVVPDFQLVGFVAARRDAQFVFVTSYRDNNGGGFRQTGLVLVDLNDDSVTVTMDDRCGGLDRAAIGADGTIYAASNEFAAIDNVLELDLLPDTCVLRIPPGSDTFDPSYQEDPSDWVGAPVGNISQGPDGTALVWAFDETAVEITEDTEIHDLRFGSAWEVVQVDLGGEPNARSVATYDGLVSGAVLPVTVDGRLLALEAAADVSTSSLRELTSDNPGEYVVRDAPGVVFTVARIR